MAEGFVFVAKPRSRSWRSQLHRSQSKLHHERKKSRAPRVHMKGYYRKFHLTKTSLPLSLCSVAEAPLFSRSFSICKLCSCVSYFLIVASRRPSNDATLRSDSERSSLWRLRRKQRIIEQPNRYLHNDYILHVELTVLSDQPR